MCVEIILCESENLNVEDERIDPLWKRYISNNDCNESNSIRNDWIIMKCICWIRFICMSRQSEDSGDLIDLRLYIIFYNAKLTETQNQ